MKSIRIERHFPHPPERVWEAVATSKGLGSWLMPNDFEPRVGHRFTLRAKKMPGWRGFVECEVLELRPRERLVFTWKGNDKQVPTRVAFTLAPVAGGTRFVLEHSGFSGVGGWFDRLMLGSGWKRMVARRELPATLEVLSKGGAAALVDRSF